MTLFITRCKIISPQHDTINRLDIIDGQIIIYGKQASLNKNPITMDGNKFDLALKDE